MSISRKQPGLIVSAAAHATLLAATLVAFNSPAKFDNAQENIPVEIVTDQAFSQISKGEKTAREVKAVQKADKVADVQETRPTPPIAEAKKDVPLPPPPLKRLPDPGEDDEPKKPEPVKTAALPPPRPPLEETKPTPAPPPRPTQAKPEPAKAEPKEAKEEPEDAEPATPKPPVRPKIEPPKAETKPPPRPEAKPEHKPDPKPEKAETKPAPTPPEKPRLKTDEVAKLLANSKDSPKPAAKPKSGDESAEPRNKFDTNAISRLLDHDKPQARGSTGREVVRTASLGTQTGTAPRMSPNAMDALNSWMMEQYAKCWHYFGTGATHKYVPIVQVAFRSDGSLASEPALLNPTSDPALTSLASAALGAVRECNPLRIPAQFSPYYEQWKSRKIAFDPEEMR